MDYSAFVKLNELINKLSLAKVKKFNTSSEEGKLDDREPVENITDANVVSSRRTDAGGHLAGQRHAILLDLDVPAYLVPSSTPGHSHLYIDVYAIEEDYFELLDALARCCVIEGGYAEVSKKRGGTSLRLPWVKKNLFDEIPALAFPILPDPFAPFVKESASE